MKQKEEFKLMSHSWAIADTGDYDGYYEITNGRVSICSKDDDDEALNKLVDALNECPCELIPDSQLINDNAYLTCEVEFLKKIIKDNGIVY